MEQVQSVTLLCEGSRLLLDVTAEIPVATYARGEGPDPGRVTGVDLGIIHPYAVASPDGEGLVVSGRAVRAEHRMHLADTKARRRAVSLRAPKPGQKGSRRWRKYRRRARLVEGRHRRRVRQAQHEAATMVVSGAVEQQTGVFKVGDPRGVLVKRQTADYGPSSCSAPESSIWIEKSRTGAAAEDVTTVGQWSPFRAFRRDGDECLGNAALSAAEADAGQDPGKTSICSCTRHDGRSWAPPTRT